MVLWRRVVYTQYLVADQIDLENNKRAFVLQLKYFFRPSILQLMEIEENKV